MAIHFNLAEVPIQITDAILTSLILPLELVPILLVIYAILRRQRLDSARWMVAIFALLSGSWYSIGNIVDQGTRFTHWTLGSKMRQPLFTLFGNSFNVQILLRTLLFLSIVYAVIRYSIANQRRQTNLERKFQNARELQQILVPETLPPSPALRSPAPIGRRRRSAATSSRSSPWMAQSEAQPLFVLGDVSGKGLQAAMTVS